MNGFIRTPKIYEFNLLIDKLNLDLSETNGKQILNKYYVDKSDLNSNGWLSGFFDADGGFYIRNTEKLIDKESNKIIRKARHEVTIRIEQRKIHPKTNISFEPIMQSILSFFTLNNKLRTSKHNGKDYWLIHICSLSKLNIFVNYLNKYPLLSSKKNDFED